MSRASPLARWLRRWHKQTGLAAALFFVFLAVSGLALNHGAALELDSARVAAPWLMNWYGLKPAVPQQGYALADGLFAAQGEVWVADGRTLTAGHGEPLGAVRVAGITWIATATSIRLYDSAGRSVDTIERDLLPGEPIRRLGVLDDRPALAIGNAVYSSADGIAWERVRADAAVIWSRPSPLDEAQQRILAPRFAPSLPWLRIIADLHSGRVFGRYGILVTDALAIGLMLLAASGMWLYWKGRPHRPIKAPLS